MEEKVRLNILALSYSQTQTGAYALILGDEDGHRRMPIIIGNSEAQAIAVEMEGVKRNRPLTHDLFFNFANEFSIEVKEVLIYYLSEGIFYSKLICEQFGQIREIDSRTSDAISLAVRFACPIYCYQEIIEKAGILVDDDLLEDDDELFDLEEELSDLDTNPYAQHSVEKLEEMLVEALENEAYEEASKIRDEIENRRR